MKSDDQNKKKIQVYIPICLSVSVCDISTQAASFSRLSSCIMASKYKGDPLDIQSHAFITLFTQTCLLGENESETGNKAKKKKSENQK